VVDWHQDLAYFRTRITTCHDLVYLERSDRRKRLPAGAAAASPTVFFNHALPDGSFAPDTEEIADGRYGSPARCRSGRQRHFLHCMLPHSSLPNRSPKPRRTPHFRIPRVRFVSDLFQRSCEALRSQTHHLRGKPSTTARFGGAPPLIPRMKLQMSRWYESNWRQRLSSRRLVDWLNISYAGSPVFTRIRWLIFEAFSLLRRTRASFTTKRVPAAPVARPKVPMLRRTGMFSSPVGAGMITGLLQLRDQSHPQCCFNLNYSTYPWHLVVLCFLAMYAICAGPILVTTHGYRKTFVFSLLVTAFLLFLPFMAFTVRDYLLQFNIMN